jgi:hypothetical protein
LLVLLAGQGVHLLTTELDERYFWHTTLVLGAYAYLLVEAAVAVRTGEPTRSRTATAVAAYSTGPESENEWAPATGPYAGGPAPRGAAPDQEG